jgi:hypothetical protein
MSHVTYLSYGAGVQSSALLAMSTTGYLDFPRPDVVIHAETQSELGETDEQVERARAWCGLMRIPFICGTAGSLERAQLGLEASRASGFTVSIPAFTQEGMLRRQCTRHHKIEVIHRLLREFLGLGPGERSKAQVRSLQGISYDEADRMKPSQFSWIENVYPLVDARISRWDCADWLTARGLPLPPKSSCVFCPYHDDEHWDWMKREHPQEFARAVAVDEALRSPRVAALEAERRPADAPAYQPAYLHSRRLPLAQIDFTAILAERRAQGLLFSGRGGFGNECEGMCGT